MTSSQASKIRRKGYHHGNLREALVLAAKQLILEKGPHGFTLVEAAKLAGVSPGAPYRHFKDQNALLAEVATKGCQAFVAKLERAWNNAEPDWVSAFMRMGEAYIEFAYEEQAFYRAMFEASIDRRETEELNAVADKAFDTVMSAALHIKQHLPEDAGLSAEQISFHISSMSHGAATILRYRQNNKSVNNPTDLLISNMKIYLQGLGIDS